MASLGIHETKIRPGLALAESSCSGRSRSEIGHYLRCSIAAATGPTSYNSQMSPGKTNHSDDSITGTALVQERKGVR